MDLRSLRYYCCYIREDRRQHVEREVGGLVDVTFVRGPDRYNGEPDMPRVCGALGHCRAIDAALRDGGAGFQPFVLLEDDVSPTSLLLEHSQLALPRGADALYLGVSKYSAYTLNNRGFLTDQLCWKPPTHGSPDVVRQFNMLSTHAILFLTPAYAAAYSRAMMEAACHSLWKQGLTWDLVSSRLGPYYNVYAVRAPYFIQDSAVGGQQDATEAPLVLDDALISDEFIEQFKNMAPLAALRDGRLN